MTIAVYAGTFDPPTLGHLNIIERASSVFSEMIVAIGVNSSKKPLFDLRERTEMVEQALRCRPVLAMRKIHVRSFDGLLVRACYLWGATVMIRGLRAATDFDYEFAIAQGNASQDRNIQTVFFPTEPEFSFVSSSLVKEIAQHGGHVREFVDPYVESLLWPKFGRSPINGDP